MGMFEQGLGIVLMVAFSVTSHFMAVCENNNQGTALDAFIYHITYLLTRSADLLWRHRSIFFMSAGGICIDRSD